MGLEVGMKIKLVGWRAAVIPEIGPDCYRVWLVLLMCFCGGFGVGVRAEESGPRAERVLPAGEALPGMLRGGVWRGGDGMQKASPETGAAGLPGLVTQSLYEKPFTADGLDADWVAEGPVNWAVRDAELHVESQLARDFGEAYRKRQFSWVPEQGMGDYFRVLRGVAEKKLDPKMYRACLDGRGLFRGGHVVIWNRTELPENYVVEFDARFDSEMGLFILFFSAQKRGGGSLFESDMAPRSGVFSQYTRGDVQSYHISTFAPQRGTAHVRRNPGGVMLQSAADLASMAPGLSYRYRLVKWGDRFQYYLNDHLLADVKDDQEGSLGGGYVGFRLMAGCKARFSRFRMAQLLESPFFLKSEASRIELDGKAGSSAGWQSICNRAKPGTRIILPEGAWPDVKLKLRARGTAAEPIVIEAGANTVLTGDPEIRVLGSWITLKGLHFQDGARPDNSGLVTQRGNKVGGQRPPLITLEGDHNRLTECSIDDFDRHHNVWLWVKGKHNRVDHSVFSGKTTHGSILNVDPTPDGSWHRVDHNYFSRPEMDSDAASVIRVGHGHIAKQPGYITIEHNLFERCNGEKEIISDKCSRNTIRFNTFRDSSGGLSLRHGMRSHVYGNWFIACRNGISIRHGGHVIEHNQFDLPDSPSIELSRGQPDGFLKRLSHVQAHDTVIRRNSFRVGRQPVFTVPERDTNLARRKVVLPERITVENNLLFSRGGGRFWSGQIPDHSQIRDNLGAGFLDQSRLTAWPVKWKWESRAGGAMVPSAEGMVERHGSWASLLPPLTRAGMQGLPPAGRKRVR